MRERGREGEIGKRGKERERACRSKGSNNEYEWRERKCIECMQAQYCIVYWHEVCMYTFLTSHEAKRVTFEYFTSVRGCHINCTWHWLSASLLGKTAAVATPLSSSEPQWKRNKCWKMGRQRQRSKTLSGDLVPQ